MIWKELNEELIFIGLNAQTYQEIMTQMGQKFIDTGYCKETYIEALIDREQEYPTGIDIDGIGIAMPHTSITHVNSHAIGIGTLQQDVTFIHMGTDDERVSVKVVFMLAVDNPNAHLEKIQSILSVIQDKEVLKKIIHAKSKNEIITIIKKKEMA